MIVQVVVVVAATEASRWWSCADEVAVVAVVAVVGDATVEMEIGRVDGGTSRETEEREWESADTAMAMGAEGR